jgi:ABC-type transport system substrate-binding protein
VISILTGATKPEDLEEHREIKRYLAEVGVQAEFVYNTDWPAFSRMLTEGAVFAFRYSWYADIPDPDNFLFKLFFSKSPRNFTFYVNPRVDELLLQAKRETDQRKRVELYREAERLILNDAPIIPFNYYTYERLFQPHVRSIEVNGLGDPYIPMKKIWLDRK